MSSESTTTVLHLASGDAWGGAEVVLLTLVREGLRDTDVSLEVQLGNAGRLQRELEAIGATVRVLDETGVSLLRQIRRTLDFARESGARAIHAHRYREVLVGAFVARRLRCPLIVTVHGLEPWRTMPIGQRARVWTAIIVARCAGARFACVSTEIFRRLRARLGEASVGLVPNPMPAIGSPGEANDLRSRFGWPPGTPVVAVVGRLESIKGSDRIPEIAARLGEGVRVAVMGDGSLRAQIEAEAHRRGVFEQISFLSEVSDPTALLPQVDVLALPSRHEGLPMVLLEAAATNVPVVAFRVGGVADVLDGSRAARLVEPGDLDGFAEAIMRAVKPDEEMRAATAAWATRARDEFGATRVWSTYRELYGLGRDRPSCPGTDQLGGSR